MVAAARAPKRKAVDETQRVLQIYGWLREELERRHHPLSGFIATGDTFITPGIERLDILAVADRIAARTED